MLKKDKIRSRLGEERTNNFGSKMVIKEYRNSKDIDVYFPQYNWMTKNKEYQNFKRGNISLLILINHIIFNMSRILLIIL